MTTLAPHGDRLPATEVRQDFHIVHGVLSLDLGGLERLVVDLVRKGRQHNNRVSVICIERPGRLANQVEDLGAQVLCLDKPAGRSREAVDRAGELLQTLRPDIVHTHQIGALWYLGQAAQRIGHPAVLHTEHSDHVRLANGWLDKLKTRLRWRECAPLAAQFCCVSDDVARSARRWGTVPRGKVDVVLNGIDTDRYSGTTAGPAIRAKLQIPQGALVIGTLGRLVEVKRQDLLIRAFAALVEQGKHSQLRLLIVGEGDERARLERLARSLAVADRTIFAGYQSHPEHFLGAMDLFVLTSRHEGLPLALLEAWASGLCVVSSAVGGIPRTVTDGANGVLFRSGDCLALTRSLAALLDAPDKMSQLGRAGRLQVEERYSLDRMAREYERRYRTLATR